jgi:hypothetical protein
VSTPAKTYEWAERTLREHAARWGGLTTAADGLLAASARSLVGGYDPDAVARMEAIVAAEAALRAGGLS